jgi:DmsE family decaheme c-type cytochrome
MPLIWPQRFNWGKGRMGLASMTRIAATLLLVLAGASVSTAQTQEEMAADVSYSKKGADSCIACHDDALALAVFKTKHAVPSDERSPFGHDQLQCEACHGPGGAHAARVRRGAERPPILNFGSDAAAPAAVQNEMCTSCHSNDVGFAWHGGPHDSNEVACADCHTSHAARDPVLQTSTEPEVCFDCHLGTRSETLKAFSHPFFQGKMGCGGCHSSHGDTLELQLVRQNVNQTCYDCHAELRGPYLWEHAPVTEDCGLCHSPHGSINPGMLVQRAPLLCQSCHSQSGHPSVPQDASGLASATPSQFLLSQSCMNCHSQVHGSNHPSGSKLMR